MTNTRSVVVGVNGSPASDEACRFACAEALSRDLPVTVVHAWQPHPVFASGVWTPMGFFPTDDALEEAAEAVLDAALAVVAAAAPRLRVERRLEHRSPAAALRDAGQSAALVVVGGVDPRHTAGWLGSVPLHVAGYVPCPVVVVAGSGSGRADVVVGVDDSGDSAGAIGFAFEEADRRDAGLVALHAFPSKWGAILTDPTRLGDLHERARAELSEALAGWCQKYPDVVVTELVSTEHPVAALRAAAEGAALLVVGSHGRGAVHRYVLGSVTTELLRRAPCPVAVVSAGHR